MPRFGRDGINNGFVARLATIQLTEFSRASVTTSGRRSVSGNVASGLPTSSTRSNAGRTEGMTRGGECMAKKILAAVMALSFLTVMFAGSADAKRRCPRGQEDVGDVCVPK